jgi:hypothetical protein
MNHIKIYDSIIKKAKDNNRIKLKANNPDYICYEKHHILPKCLGGKNEGYNIVLLTPKEHFICHKLLTYIYKDNHKIICAFFMLVHRHSKLKYKISSRDYEYLKKIFSISISQHMKEWHSKIGFSELTRKKLSENNKNKKHVVRPWKHSEQGLKNIQNAMKNRIISGKTKSKMSKSRIGKEPWNKNGHHTEEAKQKMSKSKKGMYAGNKNPMSGKSPYDIWLSKYGKEEADRKKKEFYENRKKRGKNKLQFV